jgi:hypothetical protein
MKRNKQALAGKCSAKHILNLPDLERAKSAVLNTLTSVSGQRTYDHAIDDFAVCFCSEPRLEAVRRVMGARRIGVRLGNWLTPTLGGLPLERSDTASLRGKRYHAILAMLTGWGRRDVREHPSAARSRCHISTLRVRPARSGCGISAATFQGRSMPWAVRCRRRACLVLLARIGHGSRQWGIYCAER